MPKATPDGSKTCTTCRETKSLMDFNGRAETADGKQYSCRTCVQRARYRKRYAEDADFRLARAAHNRRFREAKGADWVRERNRRFKLARSYGMTLEQFAAMNEAHGGVCAICKRPPYGGRPDARKQYLSVDHCHDTGRVRGLLCDGCNSALGMFDHSIDRLAAAIEYLRLHA